MSKAPEDLARRFLEYEPAAAAAVLQELDLAGAAALLEHLPARLTAPAIVAAIPWQAARMLEAVGPERAAALLRHVPFAEAMSLVRLVRPDARERIFAELPTALADRLVRALRYPLHQVGAWLDTDVPILGVDDTVADALHLLAVARASSHVFLETADRARYAGIVQLADILGADRRLALGRLIRAKVEPLANRATLASVSFDKRWDEHLHLPVIGRRGNLLGGLSRRAFRQGLHEGHAALTAGDVPIVQTVFAALFASFRGLLTLLLDSDVETEPADRHGSSA